MRMIIGALAVALLAGCASQPTPEQIQTADYGYSVYQGDAEKAVKDFFNVYLKDPESARYNFGYIYKGYMVGSAFEGRKLQAGYLLDVTVNAKNSFGGYVGAKPYKFLFHNDQLQGGWEVGSSGILIRVK